jgi:hypothetical protein
LQALLFQTGNNLIHATAIQLITLADELFITQRCGTSLTRDYCQERIAALKDSSIPATRDFVKAYGEPHCRQVIAWYEQASREALA